MKANRVVLTVLNPEALRTEKFAEKVKAARVATNPKTGEKINVAAKPSTSIVTVDKNNKVFFSGKFIKEFDLLNKTLTVVSDENLQLYIVATDSDVSGIKITNPEGQKVSATEFVRLIRTMEHGWSNNFTFEKVDKDFEFIEQVYGVYKLKLNIVESKRKKK